MVSELKPSHNHSDHLLFSINLCSTELSIQPDIAYLTNDWFKLFLVKLNHFYIDRHYARSIQAEQVTAKAKLLRKSVNRDIANNVYINANLTRAEAAA